MMTQEEYMDLLALRRQGKTYAEIAEQFGYPATVSAWMARGGPPRRAASTRPPG